MTSNAFSNLDHKAAWRLMDISRSWYPDWNVTPENPSQYLEGPHGHQRSGGRMPKAKETASLTSHYRLAVERFRASCSSGRSFRASQASTKVIHFRWRLLFSGQSSASLVTVTSKKW